MPEKYLGGAMASEVDVSDDNGGKAPALSFEEKIRKRERDEKLGIIAPREVAHVVDGGKFVAPGRLSKKEYTATMAQAAYVQPKPKARKYKNNPYINEEENDYVVSGRRNNKLDLTQNAPESKFLQQ